MAALETDAVAKALSVCKTSLSKRSLGLREMTVLPPSRGGRAVTARAASAAVTGVDKALARARCRLDTLVHFQYKTTKTLSLMLTMSCKIPKLVSAGGRVLAHGLPC